MSLPKEVDSGIIESYKAIAYSSVTASELCTMYYDIIHSRNSIFGTIPPLTFLSFSLI